MFTKPELDTRRVPTCTTYPHSTKPCSFKAGQLLWIVIGFSLLPGFVTAQQAGPVDSKPATPASQSAVDRLSTLGPEGEALAKRAGTWDVTFTNWEKPGAAPVTTGELVAERQMIGPMLQEILHTVPGALGPSFTRVDDLTFNRIEGRWDYMSMDTRAPVGLMPAWSLNHDPAERVFLSFQPFSMPGDGPNITGQMLRMEEIIIHTDADHDVKDQYFLPADGAGTKWLAKRYSYTRKVSQSGTNNAERTANEKASSGRSK